MESEYLLNKNETPSIWRARGGKNLSKCLSNSIFARYLAAPNCMLTFRPILTASFLLGTSQQADTCTVQSNR